MHSAPPYNLRWGSCKMTFPGIAGLQSWTKGVGRKLGSKATTRIRLASTALPFTPRPHHQRCPLQSQKGAMLNCRSAMLR